VTCNEWGEKKKSTPPYGFKNKETIQKHKSKDDWEIPASEKCGKTLRGKIRNRQKLT